MKKLLIGILALGSVCAHAADRGICTTGYKIQKIVSSESLDDVFYGLQYRGEVSFMVSSLQECECIAKSRVVSSLGRNRYFQKLKIEFTPVISETVLIKEEYRSTGYKEGTLSQVHGEFDVLMNEKTTKKIISKSKDLENMCKDSTWDARDYL